MKPQIFGLHFSGGNAYSLQGFFAGLKNDFEIELLELPGRGRRLEEPLLYTREEAVADYLRQIRERRKNVPYLVYGHSMGADLGFLVVKELEKANDPPVCFIPTGNAGPGVHVRESRASLPRAKFFDMLREMGGFSPELLENEELMEFLEPILRADFQLLEDEGGATADLTINTPVHAFMGSGEIHSGQIGNWGRYTLGGFDHAVLEGHHFFIHSHSETIAQAIRRKFIPATAC